MISTKFKDEVDLNNPLSEYPRPQFIRNSYCSLNGMWQIKFCKTIDLENDFTQQICVPFSPETPLSQVNIKLHEDEYLIYKKDFILDDNFNQGKVFVNFGAVDQIATIYINHQKVAKHFGGYTAFTCDITDYLIDGVNTINVVVQDLGVQNQFSRGKQKEKNGGIWYSCQSGIWQSVWLESTPKEYIKSVKITPNYDKKEVNFDFELIGESTNNVEISIFDGDNLVATTTDTTVKLLDFKSWSPDSPFLYNVVFKFNKDTVKSYFGMRKFSLGEDENKVKRLFLNNKPYFFNGLLDQGYYPESYLTPPTNSAMEFDVKTVKDCGYNMIRKHIKVEPMMWYYYCDVNGIVVWQDMINGGGNYGLEVSVLPFIGVNLDDTKYKTFKRTNKDARDLYYTEMQEIISQLYNCPCIGMWVLFNEGWGQFDSKIAYNKAKNLDTTRVIDTTSGWHDRGFTDVISKHIYFTPIKVKKGDKPYILSEFGGLGLKIKDHTYNNKFFGYKNYFSKKSLTNAYSKLYNKTIIPQISSGLCATVYTQLTDVEDELNGLMTYDRKVFKLDKNKLKQINNKLKY